MTALKAMFWKECRENGLWAVLGSLALSLGLAYAWFQQTPGPITPSMIWPQEKLILTLTAPLIGLALGLLQILPELRRDQWAFLVHRPASSTMLFLGKILPGLCLYLAATVLPLLGLTAWLASPTHVPAPFDARFTLAGWAAILSGLPFYGAGLLVALRPARWYGSRVLPLVAALLAPWAASYFSEFWSVALVCLLVSGALLLAAWGSFVSRGQYGGQTRPARFALGLALYPGVVAVGLGTLLLLAWGYNLSVSRGADSQEWWRNDTQVDTQGRFFYSSEHYDGRGHTAKTITDGAGHVVPPALWQNLVQKRKLLSFTYLPQGDPSRQDYRYSDPSRYVADLTSSAEQDRRTYWYYAAAARQIVGYSVTRHGTTLVGCLGPKGFARTSDGAGRFQSAQAEPGGFAGLSLLHFPEALYWYDVSAPVPTLRLLQATPGGSGTALLGSQSLGNPNDGQILIVADHRRLIAYVREGEHAPQPARKVFETPVAFAPRAFSDVQVAMMPDRSRFFFWYEAPNGGTGHLVSVSGNGRVLGTQPASFPTNVYTARPPHIVEAVPAVLLPPACIPTFLLLAYAAHKLGWNGADFLGNPPSVPGYLALFSSLGGLLSALGAWRIGRRCGDGRRGQWAWGLGVFWLGIYGVLMLLALREWPARVPCPHCGRKRVVTREVCEHCGAAFPRPARDGTEIFDGESVDAEAREAVAP